MRIAAALIIVGLLIWAAPVCAEDRSLIWCDTTTSQFAGVTDKAFFTWFVSPEEWDDTLCSEVQVFGQSFGDNTGVMGALVVYGPPEDRTTILGRSEEYRYTVLSRSMFELTQFSEEGNWINLTFDTIMMPAEFGVAIFTYNTEERGVKLGYADSLGEECHSGDFYMTKVKKPDEVLTSDYYNQSDGKTDWLIQALVSNTVDPPETVTAADLSSSNYLYTDDGTADGYITSQKHGPMVTFDAGQGKTIDRVYVYGQLVGEWFKCEKLATAYLLDKDYRIISREVLRYDRFVNEPAWGSVVFHDVKVTGQFYVLVEPLAKLDVQLEIGYDTGSENNGSFWGTPGSVGTWDTVAPEEMTNWMIRVHYK